MRYFLLAGLVSAGTVLAQPDPGTGSIQGRVFNSLTSTPVRKAMVRLTAPQIWLVADTDAEGRFEFTGLPPGTYRLSGSRSGFLDHAARRPILVGPTDHITDAEIRLTPQGVIAGRILDEDGDPVAGARVMIFKQIYRDGRKQWDRLNLNTLTSDTGEYRFSNLTPGRFLLEAENQRPQVGNRYGDRDSTDKPKMFYVPAYYPNAPSEQAASPVEVGVGTEVRAIDIHLFKVARPPVFHVSGKINGAPRGSQVVFSVNLSAADGSPEGVNASAEPPDYTFDATVRPGQYTMLAHVYSGGSEAFATGTVSVGGNVGGVVLTMSPPPEITGRIGVAEGTQVKLQGVRVRLNRLHGNTSGPEVPSDAAGKFAFAGATAPGHYSIDVDAGTLPDGCFLQNVKLGGQDISADDFEIQASAQLEIVLSNTAGKITGAVSADDGKPFPNSIVTLIPTDAKSRPRRLVADDDGNFKFTGLRPGIYKCFAWEEVDDGLWQDPEFRKKYEGHAMEVTLGVSETLSVQLHVIAAE